LDRDLYCFENVTRTASDIVRALVNPDLVIFKAATQLAVEEAQRFRDRLPVDVAGLDIGREVAAEVGEPEDRGYAVYIPVKWHAASQTGVFASIDADLEVVPFTSSPPVTQFAILGRYRPSIGLAGAPGNAILGRRLAQVAVRQFFIELAARVRSV
jgi:hypothetical protein